MPNGNDREDCPHESTIIILNEGYYEERCSQCGHLMDRWKAPKDKPEPFDEGPA